MNKSRININYRQKTLIGLLKAFGEHISNTDFQKYLFLYTQEFQDEPSFDFVPYKYGGFSFQSYIDKRYLIQKGILVDTDDWRLQDSFWDIEFFQDESYKRFYEQYSHLKKGALIQHVYRLYPYYAINSEIAKDWMKPEELSVINMARPSKNNMCFYTIGYEGSSFENYLNRLIQNNVITLIDIRRNPLSRKYGFSKKTLSDTVKKFGINYIHIPELGITSDKRQTLNTQTDYDELFEAYEKQELRKNKAALSQVFEIFKDHKRVAITCFEALVCMCHRGRVAKVLSQRTDWQYDISHI